MPPSNWAKPLFALSERWQDTGSDTGLMQVRYHAGAAGPAVHARDGGRAGEIHGSRGTVPGCTIVGGAGRHRGAHATDHQAGYNGRNGAHTETSIGAFLH